jgi:hypothetical protein
MFFHIFSGAFSWSYLGVLVLKILSHLGLGEVWISVGNCGCQWMLSCELWPSTNFLPEVDLTWHFNNQLPFAIVCSNVCRPATWNSKCLASHYTCHLQPAYVYSAIVPLWFSFVSGSAFSHVTCPTLLLANWRQDSHSAYTCVLHSQLASHPPCQAAAEEPLKPFALHCLIAPTPPLPLLKDPSRMKVYRCHISEQLGQYTCLYSSIIWSQAKAWSLTLWALQTQVQGQPSITQWAIWTLDPVVPNANPSSGVKGPHYHIVIIIIIILIIFIIVIESSSLTIESSSWAGWSSI